jgi:hypothetical protein
LVDEVNSTLCFDDNNKSYLHDDVYFSNKGLSLIPLYIIIFFISVQYQVVEVLGGEKFLSCILFGLVEKQKWNFLSEHWWAIHSFLLCTLQFLFEATLHVIIADCTLVPCFFCLDSIAYIYLSQFEVFKYWFINTKLPCIHKKRNEILVRVAFLCWYQLYGASHFSCYSCHVSMSVKLSYNLVYIIAYSCCLLLCNF